MKAYRGDVVYLTEEMCRRFPEASSWASHRPFLVVSNDVGNEVGSLVIIVPLTMQTKAMYLPTHCAIGHRPSVVLCEQIYTVGQDDISEVSWRATAQDMVAVDRCLKASLGLRRWSITVDISRPLAREAR